MVVLWCRGLHASCRLFRPYPQYHHHPSFSLLPFQNEVVVKRVEETLAGDMATLTGRLQTLLAEWPLIEDKTDLFHWAELLNRFDELLETLLARCIPAGKLQVESFSPEERLLVLAILDFSRLLLESCSSRNIFNSYDVRLQRECRIACSPSVATECAVAL